MSVQKFRKKPVVIEAIQLVYENRNEVLKFITSECWSDVDEDGQPAITIVTLEGNHLAKLTDWIIKGIAGEFYPCKSEIFDQTYDKE